MLYEKNLQRRKKALAESKGKWDRARLQWSEKKENARVKDLKKRALIRIKTIGERLDNNSRYFYYIELKDVSVADNGTVWGVNSQNDIFFRKRSRYWSYGQALGTKDPAWQHVAGKLKQISVGGNSGNSVWGVRSSGEIYFRAGFNGHWRKVEGRLARVAVCGDTGKQVWGINSAGYIYHRHGFKGNWKHIGGKLMQISCGGKDGNQVWAVNEANDIYYRNGVNGHWIHVHGKLKHISVTGFKGQDVWGVRADNKIYYRRGFKGSWTQVPGKLEQLSVGGGNFEGEFLWGINKGKTYFAYHY